MRNASVFEASITLNMVEQDPVPVKDFFFPSLSWCSKPCSPTSKQLTQP